MTKHIIIIGSGMGGATLAASLAPAGVPITILERGQHLNDCVQARDPVAIFARGHFSSGETWLDPSGVRFEPGNFSCVGGNSKFYGAVLFRYRAEDFQPRRHMGGQSPGWPIKYETLEPWYQQAELLYQVRGALGDDPTEPPHSGTYPHPPVPDEAAIADLRAHLRAAGLHPASLPLGVDLERWLARAATPWDAYPDTTGAKMDAQSVGLAQALAYPNVTLRTGVMVQRLEADKSGRIIAAHTEGPNGSERLTADTFALAAGAVQSAALLLRSANAQHPTGLANRSDQVGRNFMNHNTSALLAIHPLRCNRSTYQKTLYLNDWYLTGGPGGEPLGNVQLLGRVSAPILAAKTGFPAPLAKLLADRAIDFYAMSEDLPSPDSRVTLKGDDIVLDWQRSNGQAHEALVSKLKQALRRVGFPLVLSKPFDRRTPSHQCGTARMGSDPMASVVDPFGRAHDHTNLFLTDASILPTSAAVNPSLTIAALALRTGDHIARTELAA